MAGIILDNYPQCIEIGLRRSKISVTEPHSSTIYFENNATPPVAVDRIKIDGCVFDEKDSCLRCDWMLRFVHAGIDYEIYVELKGSDIVHAKNQLGATISRVNSTSRKKYAYIVHRSCPLTSLKLQRLKDEFQKKYRAHLKTTPHKSPQKLIPDA